MEVFKPDKPMKNGVHGGSKSQPGDSSGKENSNSGGSGDSGGGGGGHQSVHANCPCCQTTHEIKLPNPLHMECNCKSSNDAEVIKRLLPKMKLCKKCEKTLKDFAKDSAQTNASPPKVSTSTGQVCDDCGQIH